jgi:predicted enzyme related to lactoylglutathione lyase
MEQTKEHAPGRFCWIELMTTDVAAAKSFYGEVLGWRYQDSPMPGGETYTTAQRGTDAVAGIYRLGEELMRHKIPPHWDSYVAVEDCDGAAARVGELGGKVVRSPFDIMDVGRMAVLEDPTGASLCVWQANKHPGFAHFAMGQTGVPCWYELVTSNPDRAVGFYRQLFSWQPEHRRFGDLCYTVITHGGQPIGGVTELDERMQQMGVPSHWMVYFHVESRDGTVARAQKLGATPLAQAEIEEVGRIATLRDLQGVPFAILSQ